MANFSVSAPAAPAPSPPPSPAQVIVLPEPPASVPDDVNPFADEKSPPAPLKWPGGLPARLDLAVHPESFDGLTVMQLVMKGPDFEWVFDPLSDWTFAPKSTAESAAFVYERNTQTRLSLALWGPKDLLGAFTPAAITQYLAAIRASNVKGFILETPIPKNASSLNSSSFGGFNAQSVNYTIVNGTIITAHKDWFVDLNKQYLLVVSLSGPPDVVDRVTPQVSFFLGRSFVRHGLGVPAGH